MRDPHRQVQEAERIEHRQLGLLETLDHGTLRDVGCRLTIGMATHAVAGDQHRGIFCHCYRNAVLIAIARTLQAQFGTFDAQAISSVFR